MPGWIVKMLGYIKIKWGSQSLKQSWPHNEVSAIGEHQCDLREPLRPQPEEEL